MFYILNIFYSNFSIIELLDYGIHILFIIVIFKYLLER